MKIILDEVGKAFNGRYIFKKISWEVEGFSCGVITGPNGSGKSTLIRIIAGLSRPSRGSIFWSPSHGEKIPPGKRNLIGYIAPDLKLYGELTAIENLEFFSSVRGIELTSKKIKKHLEKMGLGNALKYRVSEFSSGMEQRLKLAFATIHNPRILFLDEPGTNLDKNGNDLIGEVISEQLKKGTVVLATNDDREVQQYGQNILQLA